MRAKGAGPLVIVGGRLESENNAIFAEMGRLSGGRIAVLSMASQSPAEVGAELAADFARHGIAADPIPLYWDNRRETAFDPEIVARLRECGSVFFSGGNQRRIVRALIQKGEETPALVAIREAHARGALVAGSSAGAAMMSDPMILGGTSLAALTGITDRKDPEAFGTGPGLGFFPWGIVDQHFLQRGRIGRLLTALRETGNTLGFGVDENTALVVEGDTARVCGETGVIVVDTREARFGDEGWSIRDARLS